MHKETITYVDYDGNERTEDFFFNLTKAELTEMDLGTAGGMKKLLDRIIAEKDTKRIMEIFKEIIQKSYGVKTLDGRRFIKSQEVLDEFTQTEAYSIMFMKLATDAAAAATFVNNIIPQDVANAAQTVDNPVISPIA